STHQVFKSVETTPEGESCLVIAAVFYLSEDKTIATYDLIIKDYSVDPAGAVKCLTDLKPEELITLSQLDSPKSTTEEEKTAGDLPAPSPAITIDGTMQIKPSRFGKGLFAEFYFGQKDSRYEFMGFLFLAP
ncbi:MAG: hypothetical protein KDC44_13930, partial [Phaeodactylibacter sp.]|nr:hypothetical protein [Phaeodactylibacter sp.]